MTKRKGKSRSERGYEMVAAGTHSMAGAARELGISAAAVAKACNLRGIKGMTPLGKIAARYQPPMTEEQRRARLEMARRIAAEYRKANGIPDPVEIVKLVKSGKSYAKAARVYGLTRNQVAGYINRAKESGLYDGTQA